MNFFLTEIAARAVALYLFIDSGRDLWNGLIHRKINIFSTDLFDRLMGWSAKEVQRDSSPISYWIQIAVHASIAAACLVVAIFGWLLPGS